MKPSPNPETEIQPADPAARARAIWFIVVIAILGGALSLALYLKEVQINQWLKEHAEVIIRQPGIVFLIAFVMMLPLVGVAIHIYRLADRVVKSQRIPPPGQKVIKDTPVITGRKAVRQGRGMKYMAALIGLFGLLLPFGLVLIVLMIQKSI